MVKAHQKLAEALRMLKPLQLRQSGVIQAGELKDAHRALLVEEGFLQPVIKGWYICAHSRDRQGDSTAWYVSYWAFLASYLGQRFGKRYCLNAEASLMLHTGSTIVPQQMVIVCPEGGTMDITLPFGSSLLIYADKKNFPPLRVKTKGVQAYTLAESLCRLPPRAFLRHPREVEIALGMIGDVQELLLILLERENMVAAAGRLSGALRFMQRSSDADRIMQTMKLSKYKVRETNPFTVETPSMLPCRERSPYVLRLASMWSAWRNDVLEIFPSPPGLPDSVADYLQRVDERYVADAYHSLSIEGYQMTSELIERIARQGWSPDADATDREDRNAMAARGYHQAFRVVREDLRGILQGENPGTLTRAAHHRWYAELIAPAVTAGILEPYQLAGYRNGPVSIRNSRHTPLPHETLVDAMEMLFSLIEGEDEPAVRAVLGHHLLVFIHPWFDGNGRLGRFLMNALLASGGYPWTIIRVDKRHEYMNALESASTAGDIRPLAQFIVSEMSLKDL